jgi:hypothetical protein
MGLEVSVNRCSITSVGARYNRNFKQQKTHRLITNDENWQSIMRLLKKMIHNIILSLLIHDLSKQSQTKQLKPNHPFHICFNMTIVHDFVDDVPIIV